MYIILGHEARARVGHQMGRRYQGTAHGHHVEEGLLPAESGHPLHHVAHLGHHGRGLRLPEQDNRTLGL